MLWLLLAMAVNGLQASRAEDKVQRASVQPESNAAQPAAGTQTAVTDVRVHPPQVLLEAPEAAVQLIVNAEFAAGIVRDATRDCVFTVADPSIALVSPAGRVTPRRDGSTSIEVSSAGVTRQVSVRVVGVESPSRISFRRDIIPVLSKAGCNSGGCHGKAEGQGGFKLSVFGFDPVADQREIVLDGRGRRVFPSNPDQSLLLLKAMARIPHGGGRKIEPGSRWHQLLRRWLAEGASVDQEVVDPVVRLEVEPSDVVLEASASQQLRAVAVYASGHRRGVTAEADFQSNQEVIAGVDRQGLVSSSDIPGEAAILVRYAGAVGVCRVTRPQAGIQFSRPPEANFVDALVWDKLHRLGIPASPLADDATFLRRVYLDVIGTLPTPTEVGRFLSDPDRDKRQRLIEELLARPEYADYWAQRWSDILQIDNDTIGPQSTVAMTRWVRQQMALNTPYDEFVRAILTARGSTTSESPAGFFQVQKDPEMLARSVSQLFLGVRIECAQCHHHPFERWDQPDYYALAGFFTGVQRKPHPLGGIKITSSGGADLKHPRTGELIPAAGFAAQPADFSGTSDRRQVLADWVTSAENRYFTRTIVNRLWAHYFGRGLVDPIDDLRATNPASNEPLLDALAEHLVAVNFDLRRFTQTVLESNVYQLSSVVLEANQRDHQNYSHAAWKPIPAEVLLDTVSAATGIPEQFNGWPVGYRAIQVWDNKLPSEFFKVFGRPKRQTVCACERGAEPSIAQALHLMNSNGTMSKVEAREGRAAELARSTRTAEEIIEELFLATLSRPPSRSEKQLMVDVFAAAADRREAAEDVLWTLLNTKEFVFNH